MRQHQLLSCRAGCATRGARIHFGPAGAAPGRDAAGACFSHVPSVSYVLLEPSLPTAPSALPAAAVKYCLRKMRAQAVAEEKKRQRQAKLDGGNNSGKAAGSAGTEEAVEAAAEPEAKAKGKRGRSRSASAEAEGAAAKKVKA